MLDKRKYYTGFTTTKGEKEGTNIKELQNMSVELSDFTELDIKQRNDKILSGFLKFLAHNNLIKE